MAKGGGEAPKIQQAAPPPKETDPQVEAKKATRLTQQRYAKGFLSTIQSDQQGLGGGGIATSNPVGSTQKLG